MPQLLVGNFCNHPVFLLSLKTEELRIPLDVFLIKFISKLSRISSLDQYELITNEGKYSLFQNLTFLLPIQPKKLIVDLNSKLRMTKSLKRPIEENSVDCNKELGKTLRSPMVAGGPTVPIIVLMGVVSDCSTNVVSLSTFSR